MKVLECDLCHHLFKSTEHHVTIYGGHELGNTQLNYCVKCSALLFTEGLRGIMEAMDAIDKSDGDN